MNLCTGTNESTTYAPNAPGVCAKTDCKRENINGFFWHNLCLDTLVLAKRFYHGCGNARAHVFKILFGLRCFPCPVRVFSYETSRWLLWVFNLCNSSVSYCSMFTVSNLVGFLVLHPNVQCLSLCECTLGRTCKLRNCSVSQIDGADSHECLVKNSGCTVQLVIP